MVCQSTYATGVNRWKSRKERRRSSGGIVCGDKLSEDSLIVLSISIYTGHVMGNTKKGEKG